MIDLLGITPHLTWN